MPLQPERDMGWLHGLGYNALELGADQVDRHLAAHAHAEALQGELGVVLAPVEAPVHGRLYARPDGTEERRNTQRRDRHRKPRVRCESAQRELQDEDAGEVEDRERGRAAAVLRELPEIRRYLKIEIPAPIGSAMRARATSTWIRTLS